jgi:endoglucanase
MDRPHPKIALATLAVILAAIISLSSCSETTQSIAPTSSAPQPVGLTQEDAQIGACVNMANYLEPPNEGDWGPAMTETDMRDVAAKGFKTIRLPVRFAGHAAATPPFAIDKAFMKRVVHVVGLARAANLRVIIDMHNYDELMADPEAEKARFVALWKQVAAQFKGETDMVWFELMNEPNGQLNNTNLLRVYEPALAEIRKTNLTRKVVIGGENWSGLASLATLPMLDDPNLIATFHYYDPFNFTHQGAEWATPPQPMGTLFGSKADRDQLAKDVQKAKDYMQRTGRPLFMGETGAFEKVPLGQRAAYYKAVHDAFGAAQIDQCVWGYANTFEFRSAKTGKWHDELLRAIGL